MVLGAADAIRRDIRENKMSPAELIRGRKWEDALRVLEQRHGLSEWEVELIRKAQPTTVEKTSFKNGPTHIGVALERKPCEVWPNDPTNDVKILMEKGLVFQAYKHYWLTPKGEELFKSLGYCYIVKQTNNKAIGSPETKQAVIEHNSNIDLDRDGLLTTLGKLWWTFKNRPLFRQLRLEETVRSYEEGQAEIEKNLNRIQTSEQRVARQLEAEGPPKTISHWSVEQQRQQNDLYWMNPKAFFLNPHGPLAEEVAAPEWWTPPANYQPESMRHLRQLEADDVVAQSLLAPPKLDFEPASPKEIGEKYKRKAREADPFDDLDEGWDDDDDWRDDFDHLPDQDLVDLANKFGTTASTKSIPKWTNVGNSKPTSSFVMVETGNKVVGFNSLTEAEEYKKELDQVKSRKVRVAAEVTMEKIRKQKERELNDMHRSLLYHRKVTKYMK